MTAPPRTRIRPNWPAITAALLTCAAAAAFPLIVLTIAAERITP